MRIQLWSYNYDPEPLGIGPVSTVWARAMVERGHEIEVVAAHPHYPKPDWGKKLTPYREVRDGIRVTRLPLLIGRDSRGRRLLQEASFMGAQALASPFLGSPDIVISVSPSFPALLPAMLATKARRIPWYLWLQDILPDGAATTGLVDTGGVVYRRSRQLEAAAYRSATGIVVLSESFRENLRSKAVPDSKISIAFNPATFPVESIYRRGARDEPPRIVCMGNVGRSQGLAEIVRDFENDAELSELGARLVICGTGVAAEEVRATIRTDRVEMPGLLSRDALETELRRASLALVSQAYGEGEFNVPSKLMNYLAAGLPVIASVKPESEAARIVNASSSGWIAPQGKIGLVAASALTDPEILQTKSRNGLEFAEANLTPAALAERFDHVIGADSQPDHSDRRGQRSKST